MDAPDVHGADLRTGIDEARHGVDVAGEEDARTRIGPPFGQS
jgi:hypothetical protein